MRELKFRAYHPELGMSSPFSFPFLHCSFWADLTGSVNTYHGLDGLPQGTEIMQYTGLNDSAGTEVYEGDIYQEVYKKGLEQGLAVVVWDFSLLCDLSSYLDDGDVVIGNIYENPELVPA
jgi:hypothetical protein